MSDENEKILKYVIIGNQEVGKSALVKRLVDDDFDESYISTIGVDFRVHSIKLNDYPTKLRLWDMSGNEQFKSLIPSYLRSADVVLIVFDLTDTESFDSIKTWKEDVQVMGNNQLRILLIGNKCDLTDQRTIQYEKAKELADSLGIPYIETSAKNSINIEQAFGLNTDISSTTSQTTNSNAKHDINMVESPSDQKLNLILIGDPDVGKSSLLMRFTDDIFHDSYISTIGIDFRFRLFQHNNKTLKLQIWDTASQERFRSLILSYFRRADGIIIVFDVTNTESFDNIQKWIKYIDEHGNNEPKKLLVGNKSDLQNERVIEYEKAKELADSLNISYVETSAKKSINVEQIFQALINQISLDQVSLHSTNIQIGLPKKSSKTTSGFC